jgi:hypothetical protein
MASRVCVSRFAISRIWSTTTSDGSTMPPSAPSAAALREAQIEPGGTRALRLFA